METRQTNRIQNEFPSNEFVMDSGDEILFVRRHFSLENNSQPESKDSPVVISDCDEDDSMVSADSGNQPDSLIPGSKPLDPSTAKVTQLISPQSYKYLFVC